MSELLSERTTATKTKKQSEIVSTGRWIKTDTGKKTDGDRGGGGCQIQTRERERERTDRSNVDWVDIRDN